MDKSQNNNNSSDNGNKVYNSVVSNHPYKTVDRGICLLRTQTRQWFCETRLFYSNCISTLYPEIQGKPIVEETFVNEIVEKKKTILSNFTRTEIIIFFTLLIVNFLCSCSMSIMAPFFPKEAKEKGMGITLAGFVFSFYALIVCAMAPVFGKMLPKLGGKFLFIGGMLLSGLCNICFGFLANVNNYIIFTVASFLIRGLEALGAAAFSTSCFVYVVEIYPDSVSTVMGVLETSIGMGLSIGPAVGGVLYSIGGFGLPFYFLGGIMIAAVPLSVTTLPNINGSTAEDEDGSFWKLVKNPSAFIILLVIMNSANVWAFLDPTLQPHLEQLSLSSNAVGFVFLLFSSVYAAFSLICGWLADKVDNHWSLMIIGLFISTLSLLTLGPSPLLTTKTSNIWLVLVSLCVLSASCALTLMPTFQGLLKSAAGGQTNESVARYSLVAGTWASMYSLGEVTGPILGGILLDNYGFPILSTVMAFITLAMAVIALIFFVYQDIYSNNNESTMPLLTEDKCIFYGGCSNGYEGNCTASIAKCDVAK